MTRWRQIDAPRMPRMASAQARRNQAHRAAWRFMREHALCIRRARGIKSTLRAKQLREWRKYSTIDSQKNLQHASKSCAHIRGRSISASDCRCFRKSPRDNGAAVGRSRTKKSSDGSCARAWRNHSRTSRFNRWRYTAFPTRRAARMAIRALCAARTSLAPRASGAGCANSSTPGARRRLPKRNTRR